MTSCGEANPAFRLPEHEWSRIGRSVNRYQFNSVLWPVDA